MSLTEIKVCADQSITVLAPTGVALDPDDSLVYVLHLGFPDSILLVSDSLTFYLIPPLQTGVTYFVSSVAGNTSSGMGVDLSDPCLSVSLELRSYGSQNPQAVLQAQRLFAKAIVQH